MPRADTLALGRALREITRAHDAAFLVNDSIELAAALRADGVHLGQDDAPVRAARAALGPAAIVGVSAGTPAEAARAVADGADYVGVGAVFATATKADAGAAIGPAGLERVVAAVRGRVPVIAIGGIDAANAALCARAGADGVAVVSAVMGADRPAEAAAALARAVHAGAAEGARPPPGGAQPPPEEAQPPPHEAGMATGN